jgi:hypothetical protein
MQLLRVVPVPVFGPFSGIGIGIGIGTGTGIEVVG